MSGPSGDPDPADELVAGLRQMVLSTAPYIKESSTYEEAAELLEHMEENDRNFHRYAYVKKIRGQIDQQIGQLIDSEIERHSIGPNDASTGHDPIVQKITSQLFQSPQWATMMHQLKNNVETSCDHLLDNFDHEFTADGSDQTTLGGRGKRPNNMDIIYSDGESSYGDMGSSLNHSTLFMNKEQSEQIAASLEKKKPLETRIDGLKRLLQISSTLDVQNCDAWTNIKQGLQDSLSETDAQLWGMSLRFVARGLATNNPCTRDMYATITEFLTLQFHSASKSNIPKLKHGLESAKAENLKLILMFRLMNQFQHQVTQYWIRYSESFVEEVIDSTLSILAIQHSTAVGALAHMTPMHFLAVLDPKASWFNHWMHGGYSRAPLLAQLVKSRAFFDNAVRSCMEYANSRKIPFDMLSDVSETPIKSQTGGSKRIVYTGQELEFAYFIHSLHMLGRLLCYGQGRGFFPAKVKDRDEPVTLSKLLVTLIQLITEPSASPSHKPQSSRFEPSMVVTDVLKKLVSSESVCAKCMCKDEVTNALLAPISAWLDGSTETGVPPPSEITLFQVSEILSIIASNSCGRHHLLFGESNDRFTKSKSSPSHVLAEFSKKAISGQLSRDFAPPPSKAVIGKYVFICRQLYSTSEGLQVMYSYSLHNCIAKAWETALHDSQSDRADTPTNAPGGNSAEYIVLWEDILRDQLLNFSATPKGLLLLQQTGAINECVSYMYDRYEKKLQVSKYEKFGYGYMMSQVAATAPGMVAIRNTGFIKSLVKGLWGTLEIAYDNPVYTPKTWPIFPIDKTAKKPFTNLVNLLSSFVAVNETLGGKAVESKDSYSFREMPDSIGGIIERLILVDSDAKIHSLFNYEQAHVFGLRLLSVMTSCLDTYLLLQSQYSIQESLLKSQGMNRLSDSAPIILDMLSLERNYILVKTYIIGGPNERILPDRNMEKVFIKDKSDLFRFPLFSTYPIPKDYVIGTGTKSANKQETELSKYLSETKKAKLTLPWLDKCRKAFCSVLTTKPEQARGNVIQDLLERTVTTLSDSAEDAMYPLMEYMASDSEVKKIKLADQQNRGVDLAIRYGIQLRLISSSKDAKEKLSFLLKKTTLYLSQQQRNGGSSGLYSLKGPTLGFDWFVSTIYLLMNGNIDRAWNLLHKLTSLASSGYLWMNRLHASVHLPQSIMLGGIPPVFSSSCHHIELILQSEIPHIYSAFKMSGYAPAQIIQQWIRQCFWNYLDWLEICHYISVCIVLGVDYQVYLCVAILKYLQRDILQQSQERNLIFFLKEQPIRGFRVGDHLEFMQQLASKYRKTVQPDMLNISKP